jgi:hypothetical protein
MMSIDKIKYPFLCHAFSSTAYGGASQLFAEHNVRRRPYKRKLLILPLQAVVFFTKVTRKSPTAAQQWE